jgi:pimeloyl-ACP methyl ester carboxylesterase
VRYVLFALAPLCGLLLVLAGCEGVSVHRVGALELPDLRKAAVWDSSDLTAETQRTLRQLSLQHIGQHAPAEAFAHLQKLTEENPQPDQLFALAEMGYVLGRASARWDNPNAIAFYYLSAGYAYHYLFPSMADQKACAANADSEAASSLNPFDPHFRQACDLYNTSLARCLQSAQRTERFAPGRQLRVPAPEGRDFVLPVVHQGFAWRPDQFGPLLCCADFEVEGLQNQHHGHGLGVPLIGTLRPVVPAPVHAFYLHDANFPATAFARFDGSLAELKTGQGCQLELLNTLTQRTVPIAGRSITLETDLTTPLAYFLSHTELDGIQYQAFLWADHLKGRAGLYLLEPYQPGKIPIVMVHGLLSSPVTWTSLLNELITDPEVCKHFQFWFYLYPTANPYLVVAADLRRELTALRDELDPGHHDAALDQMVFFGHSMGGSIARLLTVDSGEDFWRLVSKRPLAEVKASSETLAELQRLFFFERVPCVKRVVFLSTPHHGAPMSRSPLVRLLAHLACLPSSLRRTADDLARENPQAWPSFRDGLLPTSLGLLAPQTSFLELLAALPPPEGVHYHSIIGVQPHAFAIMNAVLLPGTDAEAVQSDGVVSYASAHVEGVDSERVVPADHYQVKSHPESVRQVRRILREHLRAVEQEQAGSNP